VKATCLDHKTLLFKSPNIFDNYFANFLILLAERFRLLQMQYSTRHVLERCRQLTHLFQKKKSFFMSDTTF